MLLCSQEPEKNALQAGKNNSRRILSLRHTIFQTLSVFESYVLFSLRRKEFPSVSAWETTWLPHLRQIFQSGSNQTVTMNRAACCSSRVDLGLPQESAPALGTLVAVAARQLLGKQFFLSCCLFLFPHTDSRPFLGLTSAEWWHTGYSGLLFCFSSFSDYFCTFLSPFDAMVSFSPVPVRVRWVWYRLHVLQNNYWSIVIFIKKPIALL